MNNSKLTEWLLDNDCPFEFDVVGNYCDAVVLIFTEKEEGKLSFETIITTIILCCGIGLTII